MKHIRSLAQGAVLGSMSALVIGALSGCSEEQDNSINENKFVILKETSPGKFTVIEEQQINGPTRIMVQNIDGTMRELSSEEMKALAQEEYAKVQAGTSEATQANESNEGMGIGSTILAVAAGSILGNMIANQLMGNKNFQRNNQAASSRARAFNREQAAKRSASKKGFFGKTGSSRFGDSFMGG